MAKKKKSRAGSKHKEFSNSPFKDLKGLSAFDQNSVNSQKSEHKGKAETSDNNDENVSFAGEMDYLGVKPLSRQNRKKAVSKPIEKITGVAEVKNDQEEFLQALGSIDKVFKDEWQDVESARRASPRRIKQVEKGHLKPQAELDLHGLSVAEAATRVKFFLQNSIYNGYSTVIIITGKGLHSDEGPVLRKAVERLLNNLSELVVEWGVAPQRYGGAGALVVFLRNQKNINET